MMGALSFYKGEPLTVQCFWSSLARFKPYEIFLAPTYRGQIILNQLV